MDRSLVPLLYRMGRMPLDSVSMGFMTRMASGTQRKDGFQYTLSRIPLTAW